MKITYVTDTIFDNSSAQAVHIDEICSNLKILGHEVVLFAPDVPTVDTNRSYPVKTIFTTSIASVIFFQIGLFFQLAKQIKKDRPDVIYSRHDLLLFVPNLLGKLFKIPVVLEVNGRLIEEAILGRKISLNYVLYILRVFKFLETFNFKNAMKIIAVTDGLGKYVHDKYRIDLDRIESISNGVSTSFFKPMDKGEMRDVVGLERDAFYVGYLGSFFGWQGMKYVLEAAMLLKSSEKKLKFVLVGCGEDEQYIKEFIAENELEETVLLHPAVPRNLVPAFINSFDICLCVPTRFRDGATSPFKIYEYLACEKPVIASEIVGMREEFGSAVAYVQPESGKALADLIFSLSTSGNKLDDLRKNARGFMDEGHTWEAVTRKVVEVIEKNLLPLK